MPTKFIPRPNIPKKHVPKKWPNIILIVQTFFYKYMFLSELTWRAWPGLAWPGSAQLLSDVQNYAYCSFQVFFWLPFFLPLLNTVLLMESALTTLLPSSFLVNLTTLAIPFLAAARCSGLRLTILRSSGQYA